MDEQFANILFSTKRHLVEPQHNSRPDDIQFNSQLVEDNS